MRCMWCDTELSTVDGAPRWEVFTVCERLAVVCYDGCRPAARTVRTWVRELVSSRG